MNGEEGCSWSWRPIKAETTRGGYPVKPEEIEEFADRYGDQYRENLKLYEPNPDGREFRQQEVFGWAQDLKYGGQYAIAWGENSIEDGHRILFASIAHSYPENTAQSTAVESVRNGIGADFRGLIRLHRAWRHQYYPRSFVTLPETQLEKLYWHTVYRYGCTARQGRAFVNTAGLWFQGFNWPYSTHDYNTQASHWALPAANRLEQSAELMETLHRRHKTLIENVRPKAWQDDSAFLHVTTAIDMIGPRDQDMRYWDLVGCLPWVLHNCWWQYRYSMDESMLRDKLFPLLRRSINFYLHMLQDEGGTLRLPPTYSPETGTHEDCNFDLALLSWGCRTLLWSCQRLNIEDPLIPRWQDVLNRLVDFPVDEHGFRLGRNAAAPTEHRHGSHLLMIYPLHLVNIEQPGTQEILNTSVERFAATSGPEAMVSTHAVPLAATIGRGELALHGLRRQAADLYPNGLWNKSPCVEGTLSFANGVQTMLLQSWGDTIRVFPAIPDEWQDVAFHDLRAEGAFLISASRRAGWTRFVRIRSLAGEPCYLKTDLKNPARMAGADVAVNSLSDDILQIDLEKGQEILLASEGDTAGLHISPL